MLVKLVLAIDRKRLQNHFERTMANSDVHVTSCGELDNPWQKVVQSCGDVIVISEGFIPRPIESSLSMLNELPEKPTTFILSSRDSSEDQAQLVAAGADVVLYSGASSKSLSEAIEATLESRRQIRKIEPLEPRKRMQPKLSDFISESEAMRMFMNEVQLVAPSNSPLLILGETGVGKEHLAKAIHAESPRGLEPFIAINTAALPEQLLESELFGHTQGSFTGAVRSRRGAFEMAHGGTIFLDEIGEMPLHLQTKLLRVLQEFEVWPVGAEKPVQVDVRVIAATNRNLEEAIAEGGFRKDLYFRLGVVSLTIPPLRERIEDIPAFVHYFIDYYRDKIDRDIHSISGPAMNKLLSYDWPGNVRELMNVIERAILLCRSDEISVEELPPVLNKFAPGQEVKIEDYVCFPLWDGRTLTEVQKSVWDKMEREYLRAVLRETRGRVGRAAGLAGIHPRGLYNKMKRLGLRKEDFRK